MGNVTVVSEDDEDGPAVLTTTSAGGLLGGRLLGDDPLVEYLDETEQPRYVLRNKKRGLHVERDGDDEHVEPHSDYQAMCVATDVRLLVVVGQQPHDESVSIPLSEIVGVDVDDGMLGGELAVVTAEDECYTFPCRGDLGAVATYVDESTQAWARAYTLLDRAETRVEDATASSDETDFAAALDAVDEAREALTDATERLAALGDGALAALENDVETLGDRIAERRRSVHEAHGESALGDARERWERREYDAAYDRYVEAEGTFERAQVVREDADVAARLERLREEWSNLKVAPVAYAEAMAAEARATDRSDTAAQCWEVALERYRDVYALDWGREERRFDVEPESVRERILVILEAAVESRIDAARDARADADALRAEGATVAACERLEAARSGLERATGLVDELRQDDHENLEAEVEAVDAALASLSGPEASV